MKLANLLITLLAMSAVSACDSTESSVTATAGDPDTDAGDSSGFDTSPESEGEGACAVAADEVPSEPFALLSQFGEDLDLEDEPCQVTAAGLECAGETYELDAMFAPYGPVPWTEGQSVRVTTGFFWFSVTELAISNDAGELLAVMSQRPMGTVGPISVSTQPLGCEDPDDPRVELLEATYTVDGESITLSGQSIGSLEGYQIFQKSAEDITDVSAGEIAETVDFVAILEP